LFLADNARILPELETSARRPVMQALSTSAAAPRAASSLFALIAPKLIAPAAGLVPVVAALRFAPQPVQPTFAAEPIVDYLPSLIDIRQAFQEAHRPGLLARIAEFWSQSTWELKWVTAAVPVLLAVFIHYTIARPSTTKALEGMKEAAIASNPLPSLKNAVGSKWPSFQKELLGRAAVQLQDDFASGLQQWSGDADWSKSWMYDSHGGVKPGALALYTPTAAMSDYQVEFTGEIEKKSLGWVFRAADTQNYYSIKLMTVKVGPMPTVAIVRSTVIGGKEGPQTQTLLPFPVSKDQVYRIRMEVSEQFFTLFVQDRVVAFWSDSRLKTGGIGFFSGKGEQSRVESVRVTHQYDALGRLCASLALQDRTSK
jgi:hypothetical protein